VFWHVQIRRKKEVSWGKFLFSFVYVLIFPVLLLLLAGNWLWPEGLIFSLWLIALCVTSIIFYIYIKDPALLAARSIGEEKMLANGLEGYREFSFFLY